MKTPGFSCFWWRFRKALGLPSTHEEWLLKDAAHEAGHAIAAWCMPQCNVVSARISRSRSEVTYYFRPKIFGSLPSSCSEWTNIVVSLAGLAGEAVLLGKATSGSARRDLREALTAAQRVALAGAAPPWDDVPCSTLDIGAMFREPPDADTRRVLQIGYRRARHLVLIDRRRFESLVEALIEHRELDHAGLAAVLGPRPSFL